MADVEQGRPGRRRRDRAVACPPAARRARAGSRLVASLLCLQALPAGAASDGRIDLTGEPVGLFAIALFVLAYLLVMLEEFTGLRKSKPVILAAGLIWAAVAWSYQDHPDAHLVERALRHNLLEYAELMLFLLVAMTYINALDERLVFARLKAWLVARGFGYRSLFWITGWVAFFVSPVADNLTTALLMCAVVMAVGAGNRRFIAMACINIVVAANAGGAFSPFGDITTLMVWQKGVVEFATFFNLLVPSLVTFLVPALMMHPFLPGGHPRSLREEVRMRRGGRRMIVLFMLTIATAVGFHNFLHLPPVVGMMTGLAYLQLFGFYLRRTHRPAPGDDPRRADEMAGDVVAFDIFRTIARAEWDTLLFFYGIVLCVGGLGFIGYLELVSVVMYGEWGATQANVAVGLLSAIVDNIPVMFAVLSMNPDMSVGQWLLVTLTAGVGGSLLSIGSAAGVALMGQTRGVYTFFSHLRWSPAILAGYALGIATHFWVNGGLFSG